MLDSGRSSSDGPCCPSHLLTECGRAEVGTYGLPGVVICRTNKNGAAILHHWSRYEITAPVMRTDWYQTGRGRSVFKRQRPEGKKHDAE